MISHILSVEGVGEITARETLPSIRQVILRRSVSGGGLPMPGEVEAATLQVSLFAHPGAWLFAPGQRMQLFTRMPDGSRRNEGVFYVDNVVWTGLRRCTVTARDGVRFLDQDIASFLNSLPNWPYTLEQLASLICSHCGVGLATPTFPNGGFLAQKGLYYHVTAASVMGWIATIAGRFCRATDSGALELAWYTPVTEQVGLTDKPGKARIEWLGGTLSINAQNLSLDAGVMTAPTGAVGYATKNLTITLPDCTPVFGCLQGGYHRQETKQPAPDSVCIGYSYAAMSDAYPGAGKNLFTFTGNRLLKDALKEQLNAIAESLYGVLKDVTYTPCRLRISAEADFRPGQILTYSDGIREYTTYVTATERVGSVTEMKGGNL